MRKNDYIKTKQHATEKPLSQWNQKGNEKIPWDKWQNTTIQIYGMKQKWSLEEVPSNELVQNQAFLKKKKKKTKTEKPQINNLNYHLKELEKNKTKIREKINKIETKNKQTKPNKTKNWFSERVNKIENALARLTKKKRDIT